MPSKVTPPFGTYPPMLCENPDCKTGPGNTRVTFTPDTPWQKCCSTECRMHLNYLKRKAKKKSEKSGGENSIGT